MAGNDELFRAMDMFKNSVKELSFQRTLSQANDAVNQVRSSELKDDEKMNQLRGIADTLTFKLASQGVPATTLQQLTSFVPKEPTSIDAAMLSSNEAIRNRGIEAQHQKDIAEMHKIDYTQARIDNRANNSIANQNAMQNSRFDMQMSKEKRAAQQKFQLNYASDVKKLDENTQYARNGLEILNANGPVSKMMGVIPFMAARASGSNSQLSDGEREAISGLQDYYSRFKQAVSKGAESEFIKENKEAFKDLFNTYIQAANERKSGLAEQYTGQLKGNPLFVDDSYDQIISNITAGKTKKYTGPGVEIPGAQQQPMMSPPPTVQGQSAAPSSLPSWIKPRGQ